MMSSPSFNLLLLVMLVSMVDDTHNCLMLHYNTQKTLMTHDTLWILWPPRRCDMTALSATDILAFLGPRLTAPFSVMLAALYSRTFFSGQGINWKPCEQLREITFEPRKNLSNSSRGWKLSWNIARDSCGRFSPKSVRVQTPQYQFAGSQTFSWQGSPHWGQKIPHENCVYTVFESLQWFTG